MRKNLLSVLLALILALIPLSASAAVSIEFPIDIGIMYAGKSVTLKPTLSGVKLSKLSWSSSDKKVAKMSKNKLTSVAEGLCTIKAKYSKTSASLTLAVLPKSVSLKTGGTHALPSSKLLSYVSLNPSVATVSDSGVITAVSAGSADISVSCTGMTLPVTVNVTGEALDRVSYLDAAKQTTQIVLVEYTSGSNATVSFHEKKDGVWKEIASTYGYVGKNGIGKTKEGDKKTPTGTYNLTTPFGIKSDPGSNMPYTKVTKYHYWCGSSSSKYYNQLIDTRVIDRARTSSDEYLISYTGVYNYCLFIDYNASGTPKKGSCIFLHCIGSNKYTAGCVAIPEKYMKQAICWVKTGAKIVIKDK